MIFEDKFIITTADEIPGLQLYSLGIASTISDNVDEIVENLRKQVKAKGGMGLIAFRITCADGKFLGYGTIVKADEAQFTMA
ncbi:conserved hypothetical protein [Methanococcus vannielii SB]|uniref:Uncharacterized protein n=2 Tax=Methanococcus vannielii TaxID=2187 RepID=A6UPU6_METVS|nr:selenium-binding protein [Methanococcus vannielii]2JZ7_A Chain A, Selenium binding protein [Methanococcus vannielii]2JZ7_B Chain B, Selenium binding protein [Methanococcus vannielii]2JZ7_C Chain C, Selenium binding protein [Methanococcus vannielii]2JZ7_D Chain D, Selenium binding protein [Methanococcus vannielii]2JZ7_E Chain E, Selenium binding protein [Methanococcus vannielii]AAV34684.1 selenium binding protein [Methanococcus vannielii]ABR54518.1 conserved hypothetical protein [Methanoco